MPGKIQLRYVGALADSSGYAAAGRAYAHSLSQLTSDIDLTLTLKSFEVEKTSHGQAWVDLEPLVNKKIPVDIQILHLTPENYPTFRNPSLYNIGYTAWETDRLPDKWIPLCNMLDEIWVPSTWNAQVFRNSGVTKPIFVVPHIIQPCTQSGEQVIIGNENTYVFYSIFQWIERKHPIGLLKAYFTEFRSDEPVILALKSYRVNTSLQEQMVIKNDISMIKRSLRMDAYPPILFFGSLMPRDHIIGLHQRGDCFVLPHRGEGFGIPIAEAMSHGKPVISSGYGGSLDFVNNDNSYLINCFETPVSGMIFPNYHGYMNWAEPSIGHLRKLMRHVYQNREEAKAKGTVARQYIVEHFNSEVISQLMLSRLQTIKASLK